AAGLEDIGALFSSDDPALEGADSVELLERAWKDVQSRGWRLANADVILIGEQPRLSPHREEMRQRLAKALAADPELVALRAITARHRLGADGRGRGLTDHALRDCRRSRPRVSRPRHRRDDPPPASRDRRRAWARCARGAGAPDLEGALPAHPPRALLELASWRRPSVRPVAAHARASRGRALGDGAALDDDLGYARG